MVALLAPTCSTAAQEKLTTLSHIDRRQAISYVVSSDEGNSTYYASTRCRVLWPKMVQGRVSDCLQQALIEVLAGEHEKFATFEQALQHIMSPQQLIIFEADEVKRVDAIDRVPQEAGMNQSYHNIEMSPEAFRGSVVVFRCFEDLYLGGAHGMQTETYVTYDAERDKVVTLSDLVTDTVRVTKLITQAAMDMEGADNVEQLHNENCYLLDGPELPVTDNIYFDGNAVHFVYQPYQIACYARGIIDVMVTVYDLENAGLATPYLLTLQRECFDEDY